MDNNNKKIIENAFEKILKGLENKEKVNASSTVLLPAPLVPIIKLVECSVKFISLYWLPVDRKFFQRTFSNKIILFQRWNNNIIFGDNSIPVIV